MNSAKGGEEERKQGKKIKIWLNVAFRDEQKSNLNQSNRWNQTKPQVWFGLKFYSVWFGWFLTYKKWVWIGSDLSVNKIVLKSNRISFNKMTSFWLGCYLYWSINVLENNFRFMVLFINLVLYWLALNPKWLTYWIVYFFLNVLGIFFLILNDGVCLKILFYWVTISYINLNYFTW